MMAHVFKVGDRVTAFKSIGDTEVKLYGHGKYLGDFFNEQIQANNPKIELDSGDIIWGCECWWMEEITQDTLEKDCIKGNKVLTIVPI